MANAFNKEEVVMFEQVLEKFDADNTCAKQSAVFRPDSTTSERAGDTIWRPEPYISRTVSGRDITGNIEDLTQLAVPASANITENVPWKLDAWELRDSLQRDRKADSAAQALSAVVNRNIANVVANTGSLAIMRPNAPAGYEDIAAAEARMMNEEIEIEMNRTFLLNANDWAGLADNLARRETMMGKPNAAYERSFVGPVAGFDTFRTSYQPTIGASTGSTTVTGAQSYVPVATQTNAVNGGESNVDNRFMDLTVGATGDFAVGDVITIAGVNAVSMINKEDLNELRTFRVTDIPDGTTLTITPPIIDVNNANQSAKEYGNCTGPAAGGAAVTAVNIAAARANSFWSRDSIEIYEGRLSTPADDMAGISVMRGSTDSGIELLFAKSGDINDLSATYRWTVYFGVTNLQPQMNGIMLFNQT